MKYRKKLVEVEAFRYAPDFIHPEWFCNTLRNGDLQIDEWGEVRKSTDRLFAKEGDYIIREPDGTITTCKPDVFEMVE